MTERRPATDQEAKALASSLRLRILRICLGQAHTNKEIAGILGMDPSNTLHHVRTLVRTGFLAAQPGTPRDTRGSGDPVPGHPEVLDAQHTSHGPIHVEHVPGGSRTCAR